MQDKKNEQQKFTPIRRKIESYLKSDYKFDWERAFKLLKHYRDEYSNEPDIHRLFSLFYMRMADFEKAESMAVESAQKYAELAPADPKALLYLGYVFWWYNKLEKAIEFTKKALNLGQKNDDIELQIFCKGNLAFYYAEGERQESALQALQFAREAYDYEKSPSRTDTLGYVIMKFAKSKEDLEDAKKLLTEALNMEGTRKDYVQKHLSELKKRQKHFK